MKIEVELNMFQHGDIRIVTVPDETLNGELIHDLNQVFYWGQNDFQNDLKHCSVSAGDVIRWTDGKRYLITFSGFEETTEKGTIETIQLLRKIMK